MPFDAMREKFEDLESGIVPKLISPKLDCGPLRLAKKE